MIVLLPTSTHDGVLVTSPELRQQTCWSLQPDTSALIGREFNWTTANISIRLHNWEWRFRFVKKKKEPVPGGFSLILKTRLSRDHDAFSHRNQLDCISQYSVFYHLWYHSWPWSKGKKYFCLNSLFWILLWHLGHFPVSWNNIKIRISVSNYSKIIAVGQRGWDELRKPC